MPVQPNKAIVGANAFSDSSGIHQDGVLKAKNTYEIITPEGIGLPQNNLNMTSRSGRHVIKHRMESMGYAESSYDLDHLYGQVPDPGRQEGASIRLRPGGAGLLQPASTKSRSTSSWSIWAYKAAAL
ncbi:hypothetical protein ACLK1W_00410 [Escherichia coli]